MLTISKIKAFVLLFLVSFLISCSDGTCDSTSNVPKITFNLLSGSISNAPTTPIIEINSSVAMDLSSFTSENVRLNNSTKLNIISNSSSTIFYVTVATPLEDKADYVLSLSDIKSSSGVVVSASFNFTTGDFTQPSVVSIMPSNGATDVSRTPIIQLQFSESVQNVNNSTITLHLGSSDGDLVSMGVVYGANNTYSFSPIESLLNYTTYYIDFSNQIKDNANNPLDSTNLSFTTGDFIQPEVIMVAPLNRATGVSKTPLIQLHFSQIVKNVNSSTILLHVGSPNGGLVSIGNLIAGSDNTYTLSSLSPLLENTTYYIEVSSDITSVSGEPVQSTYFTFTTGDFTQPEVLSSYPSNGSINVTTTPTIQLHFSESMNNVDNTTVTLHSGSATGPLVPLNAVIESSDNTYIFSPVSALSAKTLYYIELSNQITDLSNNMLAHSEFTFTTGTLLWVKQLGMTNGTTNGFASAVDSNDDSSFVVGNTDVGLNGNSMIGNSDAYIAKYNANGVLQWVKQLGAVGGNVTAYAIALASDGTIFISGSTNVGLNGNLMVGTGNAFIAKYDSNGNLLWVKQLGVSPGNAYSLSVALATDGSIYISGNTTVGLNGKTQQGILDYFIAKYDSVGTLLWLDQDGRAGGFTEGRSITLASDGSAYVAGFTNKSLDGNVMVGFYNLFLAKYDSSGTRLWLKQLGASSGVTYGYSAAVASDGSIYISGNTSVGLDGNIMLGNYDAYLAKYDNAGGLLWVSQLGASGAYLSAKSLALTTTGDIYFTGNTNKGLNGSILSGKTDAYLAKYDNTGAFLSVLELGGLGSNDSDDTFGYSVSTSDSGFVYMTGMTRVNLGNNLAQGQRDLFIAKYL